MGNAIWVAPAHEGETLVRVGDPGHEWETGKIILVVVGATPSRESGTCWEELEARRCLLAGGDWLDIDGWQRKRGVASVT